MKILILAGPSVLPYLDAIRQEGHQILLCERLEEAEAVLFAHAETLDLIWLSDKEGPSAARPNPMGLGFFHALSADPVTAGIPVVLSADGWSQKEVEQFGKGARLPHGLIHGHLTPERLLEALKEVILTDMPPPPSLDIAEEVAFQELEIEMPGLAPPPPSFSAKPEEKKEDLSQIKPLLKSGDQTKITLVEFDTLIRPSPLIDEPLSIRFEPFEENAAGPGIQLSEEQAEAVLEGALSFDLSLDESKSQLIEEDQLLLTDAISIAPPSPKVGEIELALDAPSLDSPVAREEDAAEALKGPLEPSLAVSQEVEEVMSFGGGGPSFEAAPKVVQSPAAQNRDRERALEVRLDLAIRDAAAKLRVREQKLLELQRQLDMAEFNVDMLTKALQKERHHAETLESKLKKVMLLLNSVSDGVGSDSSLI